MRHTFVLDENVAISATTLRNASGHRDNTCLDLVGLIIRNCHRIAWSLDLHARWSEHIQQLRLRGEALEPTFMTTMGEAFQTADKCVFPETGNPPHLDDDAAWPSKLQDDSHVLRLAAFFSALLVTDDRNLRHNPTASDLARQHGFVLLPPDEALEWAAERTS